ncbi:hypothetical protein CesoFtcFv8_013690 [Champsocephalus esox]|uniref:PHD-type domain-containing protein n=1 Tax=Champsocephalus esox TaxID=159716 RepID=A0AAN8BTV0_9TELE|nr:hypothetical protein CesoFtcFv8_013690 [Champsocephalus esox]
MHEDARLLCVLCQRSEQTKFTGALSTKEDVTAHQNCLLFSSALFCRNTPQFDNLFGFSVDDVLGEVKRGRQLICNKCKTRGATVGCEVGRCKKSYHYPCAVEERAKIVEDVTKEKYVQNGTPSKRRSKVSWASLRDDSSISGDNEPDSITAPLVTEIDDSEHLTRETHICLEEESRDGAPDEDETEAESESRLPPIAQPLPASQADFSTQTPPMSPVFPRSEVWCKTETQKQADDGGTSFTP